MMKSVGSHLYKDEALFRVWHALSLDEAVCRVTPALLENDVVV